MNPRLYAGILSVLMTASICAADEVVVFGDTNLQRGVERALGLQRPTQSEMLALTKLEVTSKGIVDLTGIEYATNLTTLRLVSNQISDLRPLAGLTRLTTLDLKDNQISDITDLRGLVNLTELILWRNRISDISPLSNLTALTNLQLNENRIADISGLWPLTKLTNLMLGGNPVSDITVVSRMKSLLALILHQTGVRNLSPLSGLTTLRVLNVDGCGVTDISVLAGLTALSDVHLSNNPVSDISPLLGLRNLRDLNLDGTSLNGDAYCIYLRLIQQNNPVATIVYSPNAQAPGGVSVSDGAVEGRVTVTWEPVCSGPGYTACYRVYRALSGSDEKTAVSGWQTRTSFQDTTAAPDTVYNYWVTAAADTQGTAETGLSSPDRGWCTGRRRTLTVSSTAGGVVVTPGVGAIAVNYGQSMSLTARAGDNYAFAGWTGTAVDAGKVADPAQAGTTVTVDGDYTLRANFITRLKVLYVEQAPASDPCEDGTWEHPFDGIQEAIEVAPDETVVGIGAGIFRERIDFQGKDILVIGAGTTNTGGVDSTVIDGNDAGPVVTFRGGETASCILMDVIVTHGNGVNGGGILCGPSSAPTIRRCAVFNNFAMRGAGLYLDSASPVLIDCRITGNTAVGGAGLYCLQGAPKLVASAVSRNFAVRAAGLYCDHTDVMLIDSTIENNAAGCGGGLYLDQSEVHLSDCALKGNTPSLFFVGEGASPEIIGGDTDSIEPTGCSEDYQTIDEFWAEVMSAESPDQTEVMRFLISVWGTIESAGR